MAVHFLVQRLSRLTHLSLTGVPAFRKPELQRFCRAPPGEFNQTQRAAFCVYSGAGVGELRRYLAELYNDMASGVTGEETEYDEDDDEEMDDEVDGDGDDEGGPMDVDPPETQNDLPHQRQRHTPTDPVMLAQPSPFAPPVVDSSSQAGPSRMVLSPQHVMRRDNQTQAQRYLSPTQRPPLGGFSPAASTPMSGSASNSGTSLLRGFPPDPPISENQVGSTSSAPQRLPAFPIVEAGSPGSSGSGAAFFRNYPGPASVNGSDGGSGVRTPDLNFAEIGHGRGSGYPQSAATHQSVMVNGDGHTNGLASASGSPGRMSAVPSIANTGAVPEVYDGASSPPRAGPSRGDQIMESPNAAGVRGRSVKAFRNVTSSLFGRRERERDSAGAE